MSKFLRRGIHVSFASNKRNTDQLPNPANAGRGASERRGLRRGGWRLNYLNFRRYPTGSETRLEGQLAVSDHGEGGGCMLYEIIAAVGQISFSNDTVTVVSDAASTQPPARAPDNNPSSTR